MKVLSKVLWAIDLNSDHKVSIEKMRRLTVQFGNELILLHVLPLHIKKAAAQKKIAKSIQFEMENKIAEHVTLPEGKKVKIRIEIGDVAEQINKVASEENVNLVVISKGKTATLGPNGFNTIRKLQKPVAILPKSPPGAENHIVCPVDNSEASSIALNSAILHARKIDAKLTIISVHKPITITSPRLMKAGLNEEKERDFHYQIFKKELKDFLKDFDFSNVDAEALILQGNVDEEIIKFSKKARILYVGNSGKRAIQRAFMGSVSEKVIREAKCTVVTVKNENVFKLSIPPGLDNAEKHFKRGNELRKLGFPQEAIQQYKAALKANEVHFSSLKVLAQIYAEQENLELANYYKEIGDTIKTNMHHRKIEHEIRQNFKSVS